MSSAPARSFCPSASPRFTGRTLRRRRPVHRTRAATCGRRIGSVPRVASRHFRAGVVIAVGGARTAGSWRSSGPTSPGSGSSPRAGSSAARSPSTRPGASCSEETGLGPDDVELVGEHPEWVLYEWPAEVVDGGQRASVRCTAGSLPHARRATSSRRRTGASSRRGGGSSRMADRPRRRRSGGRATDAVLLGMTRRRDDLFAAAAEERLRAPGAARRPAAAAHARRRRRAGAPARPGPPAAPAGRAGPAVVGAPLGSARHRQDDARPGRRRHARRGRSSSCRR